MSNSVIAIYPGTFDPITLGHQALIRRATGLFDTVVVAVAIAHHKKTLLDLQERLALARAVLSPYNNVRVESFSGLVIEFAKAQGAQVMLRGLRSAGDLDYESALASMNKTMAPALETVFLLPEAPYQHISSTLVREIALLQGDVSGFVAPEVLASLQAKAQSRVE